MLDKRSHLPLHQQLKAAIEERILSGEWLPGAQGRGTFVASPRIEQQLTQLTGFTQDMRARGKRPSARVLEAANIAALPRALKIKAGESVAMLKRLRLADGEPMAIETAYLPESCCQGILKEKLAARSLYDILARKYRLNPVRAMQQMEAIACPAAEAKTIAAHLAACVERDDRILLFGTGHSHYGNDVRRPLWAYWCDLTEWSQRTFHHCLTQGNHLPAKVVEVACGITCV